MRNYQLSQKFKLLENGEFNILTIIHTLPHVWAQHMGFFNLFLEMRGRMETKFKL